MPKKVFIRLIIALNSHLCLNRFGNIVLISQIDKTANKKCKFVPTPIRNTKNIIAKLSQITFE